MDYKIPEVIPDSCGECKYFKKTGVIDRFKGYCEFYDQTTFTSYGCLAKKFLEKEKSKQIKKEDEKKANSEEHSSNEENSIRKHTDISTQLATSSGPVYWILMIIAFLVYLGFRHGCFDGTF
ncbi:MAG: hypothetical protein ACE5HI_14090 [bacterium]